MTAQALTDLELLLVDLEQDINLCTTREQLIRATQRVLHLQRVLAQLRETV